MEKQKRRKPVRKKIESPFAHNLKLILKERALAQKSAADIMGVSVSVVNDWLQGVQPHNHNAILKFCRAMNCDFQWLLTGERSHSVTGSKNLHEFFDVQDDPLFSGMFVIEAKRLKIKKAE